LFAISIFCPLCKKMLLISRFADNIFSVVRGRFASLTLSWMIASFPLAVTVARTPAKSIIMRPTGSERYLPQGERFDSLITAKTRVRLLLRWSPRPARSFQLWLRLGCPSKSFSHELPPDEFDVSGPKTRRDAENIDNLEEQSNPSGCRPMKGLTADLPEKTTLPSPINQERKDKRREFWNWSGVVS
jgi:hypothetical protein